MQVSRRTALGGIAAATLGTVVRARDAALEPGLCGAPAVAGFDPYCFTDSLGERRQVYVADGGGPPVILLHEIPGLIATNLAAATRLARERYTVVAPLMFGEPGGAGHGLRYTRTKCGKEQFACNSGERTSPHVRWLRELAVDVRQRWPEGKGVGAIGMCVTGAFPLAMLREPVVVAPVLCQPTIPFSIWTRFGWFTDKDALGVSPDDLDHAKNNRDTPLLGIRYLGDWKCRRQRFDRLATEFPSRFHRLELAGKHHSTIGRDFCDLAFQEITAFLNHQLRTTPDPGGERFPRYAWTGSTAPKETPPCSVTPHHPSGG